MPPVHAQGMKSLIICVFTCAGLLAEANWKKEPKSFKGVPFNSSEATTKQILAIARPKLDFTCSGPADRLCVVSVPKLENVNGAIVKPSPEYEFEDKLNFVFTFHKDRFVEAVGTFENPNYEQVKAVFIERYGTPTRAQVQTVQSAAGASFENETLHWGGRNVDVTLSRFGDRVDTGNVHVCLKAYMKAQKTKDDQEKKKAASVL
jgi:hypothetical protein